jgi:F0F1-type ATP synthase membrane subunit b/b'
MKQRNEEVLAVVAIILVLIAILMYLFPATISGIIGGAQNVVSSTTTIRIVCGGC